MDCTATNPEALPRGIIPYWGLKSRSLYELYRRTAKKAVRRAAAQANKLSTTSPEGPFRVPDTTPPGSPSKPSAKSRRTNTNQAAGRKVTQTSTEGYREHTEPDPNAIEVITDDPNTRNKVPIPITLAQRMDIDKYVMPRPDDMTDLPVNVEFNPHLQTSHDESIRPNPMPDFNALSFTMATFPRPVVPGSTLLANLNSIQKDAILAGPDKFIAILPTGAGTLYFRENPNVAKDLLEFLGTLGVDAREAEVVTPSPAARLKDDFAPPFVLILTGASPELRSLMLYIQTFAVNPSLSFHALPFNPPPSWFIMNIACDSDILADTDVSKSRFLGAVKGRSWSDPQLTRLISQAWAASHPNTSKSPAECRVLATRSWNVTFVDSVNLAGHHSPYFMLTGQPITEDPAIHKRWLSLIRGFHYFVGIQPLKIFAREDECRWCKADAHPSWECPFPRVEGWFGRKIPMTQKEDVAFRASLRRANGQKSQAPRGGGTSGDSRRGRGRGGLGH